MTDDQSINLFERAQQSPLFQLSLSSKEIFHRNLIAWLIQADPGYAKVFASWLSGLLGIDGASGIRQIERERKNIDLSFKWDVKGQPETVHIELKVKSLPLVKQLRDYAEKKPADRRILISVSMTPSICSTIVSDGDWSYIPFKELSNLVDRLLEVASTPYHQQLLLDYREIIPIISIFAGNKDVTPETHYGFHKAGLNPNLYLAQRLTHIRGLYLPGRHGKPFDTSETCGSS